MSDETRPKAEDLLEEVSTDYKGLFEAAGIDFKKAKSAMVAYAKSKADGKDASDISSSREEAQEKAQKAVANYQAVKKLISNRNTLNVELRRPKKSSSRHARRKLRVLDHMGQRISALEEELYDANPDDSGGLKAYVTEVHELSAIDIDDHPMSLNVRELVSTAAKTSASGMELIMVRARCPHNHYWADPDEPTSSPLSSDTDRYRAKCQPSFYGFVKSGNRPTVGDIVSVEFPDKTDLSCGILLDVFLTLPAVKVPLRARNSFNGTGSTRVGK